MHENCKVMICYLELTSSHLRCTAECNRYSDNPEASLCHYLLGVPYMVLEYIRNGTTESEPEQLRAHHELICILHINYQVSNLSPIPSGAVAVSQ